CADCADDVRVASRMRDGAAAGMTRAISAVRTPRRRVSSYAGWALAASLAIVAGYQAVALRQREPLESLALGPVTLRAGTRGADAVVAVAPGAAAVTLAVPIDVAAGPPLAYELRAADNR